MKRPFATVSAVRRTGDHRFTADADPAWTVAGKPNGGYLLAMMARAASEVSGRAEVLTASAVYLDTPQPGGLVVETELLRAGRSLTHVRARLSQDAKPCVEALILLTDPDPDAQVVWDAGVPAVEVAPFTDCVRLAPFGPGGIPVEVMGQNEVRLDPDSAGFLSRQPTGSGELRGWLTLGDGEPFDAYSLLYAVDALPPATFEIRTTGWVPTLELTAYVRARPAPGPVRVVQRAQLVGAGRVDEVCLVWDADGRLVAQATQLAGVRMGTVARRDGARVTMAAPAGDPPGGDRP